MRAIAALLLVLGLAAPLGLPASEAAVPAGGPRLVLDSDITWREDWDRFGGFSALWVSPTARGSP